MSIPDREQIETVVDSLVRARSTVINNPKWDPLPEACCPKLAADLNIYYKIRLSASELHGKTIAQVGVLIRRYLGYSQRPIAMHLT